MYTTILALVGLFMTSLAESTPTSSYECGACMLMINEMEALIRKVDPAKTIEVGSFRVDPNGGQKGLQKIPFARSDLHLNEIFDGICQKAKEYKLVVNSLTGKAVFVHKDATYLREEKKVGVQPALESACNNFADTHEDKVMQFLKIAKAEPQVLVKEFCHSELNVCSLIDVAQLPPNNLDNEKLEVEDEL